MGTKKGRWSVFAGMLEIGFKSVEIKIIFEIPLGETVLWIDFACKMLQERNSVLLRVAVLRLRSNTLPFILAEDLQVSQSSGIHFVYRTQP